MALRLIRGPFLPGSSARFSAVDTALRHIRHVVLDLDGTVYLSGRLFPWTLPFFATLHALEIGYTLITNNCSRSTRDYVEYFRGAGIEVTSRNVYTAGQATIDFLREHQPTLRHLYLLGTDRLAGEFAEAGYSFCDSPPGAEPEAVVVAFDTSLTFSRLCQAAYWIQRGKPFFATHPDRVCPTNQPTVLVDCGAVCACLSSATGRQPDAVLGKPSVRMLEGLLRREKLRPHEVAVVGDRLYTDIKMACDARAVSVLVLSGETTADEAQQSPVRPALVVCDLGEFGELLRRAHGRHEPAADSSPTPHNSPGD